MRTTAFRLNNVVPWGRNFSEYASMFQLTQSDKAKKIAGFGDGPASFNFEATQNGYSVTSIDPLYQFSKQEISQRIAQTRIEVMQQMKENSADYVWKNIRSLSELEEVRMTAMKVFLNDYEAGKSENRYICCELPERTPFFGDAFDIGLSSHFLLMYTELGYNFHIKAISEMLRVCKEIRIFPIIDLAGNCSKLADDVISYFSKSYSAEILKTDYEFQKGGDKLLIIKK